MRYPLNQLCYIAGILMFFMTLTEILRLTVVLPRSRRTAAVVTKVRPTKPEDLSRRKAAGPGKKKALPLMAFVTYSVEGRNYFSGNEIPVPAGTQVGDQVKIRYAVQFPDMIVERSFSRLLLFAVFSLLFFLLGFLV